MNPLSLLRNQVYMPWARIPSGELVELPGRGTTYVTDTAGPDPESPTIVLLHALGCTGLLTWFPCDRAALAPVPGGHPRPALARPGHPAARSSRWSTAPTTWPRCSTCSGSSERHRRRLLDGLDRRPAGLAPAPGRASRAWCWPRRPTGSAEPRASGSSSPAMEVGDARRPRHLPLPHGGAGGPRGRRRGRPRAHRHPRVGARGVPQHQPVGGRPGARRARPAPLAALAGPHRRAHRGRGPQRRPRHPARTPARRSPAASPARPIHDIDAGHAACVLETEVFVPAFLEAAATVNARRRDFRQRRRSEPALAQPRQAFGCGLACGSASAS